MIQVFAVCYWMLDYAKQSLDSIIETASEPLDITVIENRSKHSDKFLEWGKECLKSGKINKFIVASENTKGKGLLWAYHNTPKHSPYVIFTDLDIVVPKEVDWVYRIKQTIRYGGNITACGFSLDTANYTPPNGGFDENGFGNWLMCLHTRIVDAYPQDLNFQDYIMLQLASCYGNVAKHQDRLIHLGWDAWKDDPEYWQDKLRNFNWQSYSNPTYTVYTKDNIDAALT